MPSISDSCGDITCARPVQTLGFCNLHYKRWRRRGTTHDITPEIRFFSKVSERGDCWIWGGTIESTGYGRFWTSGRGPKMAHRWSYEFMVGEIPAGLHLDHLCRVIACVNPWHLDPVSARENVVVRGTTGPSAQNARKTHCIHGHEFTNANTYITKKGQRYCKECGRARNAGHSPSREQRQ